MYIVYRVIERYKRKTKALYFKNNHKHSGSTTFFISYFKSYFVKLKYILRNINVINQPYVFSMQISKPRHSSIFIIMLWYCHRYIWAAPRSAINWITNFITKLRDYKDMPTSISRLRYASFMKQKVKINSVKTVNTLE